GLVGYVNEEVSATEYLARVALHPFPTMRITHGDIITLGTFIAMGSDTWRATRIRDPTGNDPLSVLTLIGYIAFLLLLPSFMTMTFTFIVVASIIDVILDRVIGQAVARRDTAVGIAGFPIGRHDH